MDWNVTYPSEQQLESSLPASLGHLLHELAAKTPSRPAFVFFDHDEQLTYLALSVQVRRMAASLRLRGIRKGTHVAIMMPNRIEFPVTWFALAWLGAISVQLNPRYTGSELDYALNDADVDALVVDETCLKAFESMAERPERLADNRVFVTGCSGKLERYIDWKKLIDSEPLVDDPLMTVGQHDVVSILYTSGTTGFPKGCMLDHRYWLQLASTALYCQGGHKPRNVLVYEPMFYMQGNFIFLLALMCSATVYCPARPSISKLLDWIEHYQIDYCAFPAPAVVGIEKTPKSKGRSLKWVHAWYYHGDQRERLEKHFDVVARDVYGMTENGGCLFVPVDRPDIAATGAMGIPAPWRELRIVDDNGLDVADGDVGELWTSGPGHLHGYYRKPEANSATFDGPWFKTGDLMRRGADGEYYLIGRIKDMVKRSGENISAAEVEDCLCKLPGILMAAIVAVPDVARDEEIKAYIQLEEGMTKTSVSTQQILRHCEKHLASFKVPRYIAYVDSFPMTAGNDKVAKPRLIAGVEDLTLGAYDRVDEIWR